MKQTPVMANQMLAVGRTIWDWAIPLGLAVVDNPFDKVKDFDIPDRGHVPWPSWVVDHVCAHAWSDLVRLVRLGIMTCQRGSDVIRMEPGAPRPQRDMVPSEEENPQAPARLSHSARLGRRARRSTDGPRRRDLHKLPLAETHRAFPRGSVPLFAEGLAPIHPRRSARALGAMARRHSGRPHHLPPLVGMGCRPRSRNTIGTLTPTRCRPSDHSRVARYTGILARAEQGYEVDQIANDIGMSRQNVEHYMRFRDQMKVGVDGQKRLRLVNKED